MRTLVLWSLLLVVPLGNVRMICYDLAARNGAAAAAIPDCEDLCDRRTPPAPDTGCVLVAGGCATVLAVLVALPVPVTPVGMAVVARPHHADANAIYRPPSLSTDLRPPRA